MSSDEWRKCAAFMAISGYVDDTRTSARGIKVMGVHVLMFYESPHFCVYTFSFSRRRYISLSLSNEQNRRTKKVSLKTRGNYITRRAKG